ncbi:hypothetical protein [Polyangium jinanense]|uniref:Beta-propeller repeat-containing protein n=1 Tax=Polyangium jinanense TaxID=2829994 RepID=A0A9X3X008_9BACT|nr:hypothetical protein [Polyangium jinanense]MDC3953166.1 hypothetical protein [Polyangium jinanense]MDC3979713.1 hypothetical protein [Polyangium jinanense]
MRFRDVALGLVGFFGCACGGKSALEVESGAGGAGNGSSSASSSSSGGGGVGPGAPYSLMLSGKLATYPLAIAPDGSAWVFGGTYTEPTPGYPEWESAWVSKIDPHGTIVFTGTLDGEDIVVEPIAIKTDAEGNVLLTAYAKRTPGSQADLDILGNKFGTYDEAPFIVRLDPSGNILWVSITDSQKTPSDPPAHRFTDIGADGEGNVYVAGSISSPFVSDEIDSEVTVRAPGGGTYLDGYTMPAMKTVFWKLEVEPNGDFWLARSSYYQKARVQRFKQGGQLQSEVTESVCWVDVFAFAPDGKEGFFMARAEDPAEHCYSSLRHHSLDGKSDWFIEGTEFYAVHTTLTRSSPGRAWLGLGLEGTININGSTLTGKDYGDIVVAEIDEHGTFLQSATYGGPGDDYVEQIALDDEGRRYMAGYFTSQIDFGQGELVNSSGQPRAIFVTRLDP